jgi:hypothetical protein
MASEQSNKLHWLAVQALVWSEMPVVTARPTVFAIPKSDPA